jgi:hypothetical protein
MCFHQELLAPLSLRDNPYHYCAVAGRPELAAYLYKNGIPCVSDMTVATFSAGGVEGESVWKKGLTLTPCEAALMAGNTVTAEVLKNIERLEPSHYHPTCASHFISLGLSAHCKSGRSRKQGDSTGMAAVDA